MKVFHVVLYSLIFCTFAESSTTSEPNEESSWATASNCTDKEFTCGDGSCIPIEERCNFFENCLNYDGSDEEGCVRISCNFEDDDLCGWGISSFQPPPATDFKWVRIQGENNPMEHSPKLDHTFDMSSGYYLFANTTLDTTQDEAVTNLYPVTPFGRTSENCRLTFWYWLSGSDPGSLHIRKWEDESSSWEIWMKEGNQQDLWHFASVTVGDLHQRNLSIEAHRGITYNGGAALDDFHFHDCLTPFFPPANKTCQDLDLFKCTDGMCALSDDVCDYAFDCFDYSDEKPLTCLSYKFRCDFEIGFCKNWQQDIDDTSNWLLLQASTEVSAPSPEVDHTMNEPEGHYILLDTMPAIEENATAVARIHSPVLLDSGEICILRFWYRFSGNSSSFKLKTYARVSYYTDGMKLVVDHSNAMTDVWTKEFVSFTGFTSKQPYQVVIEGETTKYGFGNLVIDDLSMTPNCEESSNQHLPGEETVSTPAPICPPGQLDCNDGQCYYPSDVCNFQNDCSDGTDEMDCAKDCDFETEENFCGWFENAASSIHWQRTGFPASQPGPAADHDGNNATYDISISKDYDARGQQAILETTMFSGVNKSCVLEAWYYMTNDGSDNSSLELYIEDEKTTRRIWEAQPQSSWEKMSLPLSSELDFILSFRAVMGNGKAYTALDDITFKDCAVQTRECTSTEFQCIEDSNCIPNYRVCDATYDCNDKTDEEKCNLKINQGDCDFDHRSDWLEICKWEQFKDDDIDWILADHTNSSIVGPQNDHTLGDGGYYIYVGDSEEPGMTASVAPMFMFPPSSEICYVRYWYYLHDDSEDDFDLGTLNVYLQDNETMWLRASHSALQPSIWKEEIMLVTSDKDFRVIFEGETGDIGHTYIALDDVSFTRECVTGIPPEYFNCSTNQFECKSGQCIPQRLHCNYQNECKDESDEVDCPDPPPPDCKDTEFECRDNGETCIAAALLCDGVNDCPNNVDEDGCPGGTPCKSGSIFCYDQGLNPPCIGGADLCNGNVTCQTFHADESLCGQCPEFLCLNQGVCHLKNAVPSCTCINNFTGNRCEKKTNTGGLTAGAITGIVVGCLAFVILVIGMIYYYIQKKRVLSSSGYILNQLRT